MKPYEQSERQIGGNPQRDNRERIVVIACALAAMFALCIVAAESHETPAPVQIAAK